MKFLEYSKYLDRVAKLSSRNEITVVLAEMINKLTKEEYESAFYLMQGRLVPLYRDLEFNFSTKLLLKLLSEEHPNILERYKKFGDLGLAVEDVLDNVGGNYSLVDMYASLKEMAIISGENSQESKAKSVRQILKNLSPVEAKYLVKIVIGKLRLGVSDKTILDSISWAIVGDKSLKPLLEEAYGIRADLPEIARIVYEQGQSGLKKIELKSGVPVASKLVEREKSFDKIVERFPAGMIVQPKYDGLRMQIHYSRDGFGDDSGDTVRLFSRNMGSLTKMFPEVVEAVKKLNVASVILDSEVIGFDLKTGKMLPFQETASRKRKNDVAQKSAEIPVKVYCFDILLLEGHSMMKDDLVERLGVMRKLLSDNEMLISSESIRLKTSEELKAKFDEYNEADLEGLIAKSLDSEYKPGTRNYDWIKLKVRAQDSLADSIDAVILGYYLGRGQRAKFGIGAILVGIRDEKNDKFISIAKVGTGFKDADWKNLKERIDDLKSDEIPDNVIISKQLMPDIVCIPEIVCVVEADEVSISKVHGVDGEGYSLRFPRFKTIRSDKSASDATTTEEVKKLYRFAKSE